MKRQHRHSDAVTRTPRWKALRFQALRRDDFKCTKCGAVGRLEVDHIVAVRKAPERSFDLQNLQTLCARCHGAKTRAELGFPELSPARKAWRDAVSALLKPGKHEVFKCSKV